MSERSNPGPFANLWQAHLSNLDTLAKGCEPAFVGLSRWNMEMATLAIRRTQAWLEVPARLGSCRTAPDLTSEQIRFWQKASTDYREGVQRIASALLSAATPVSIGTRVGAATQQPRDYIAVAAKSDDRRSERRAA
jgi:hypothetical protein